MRRLPKRWRFPGGFLVDIRLVARGVALDNEGTKLEEGDRGAYVTVAPAYGIIYLWRELTPKQRWRDLAHELLHALVDAQNWIEQQTL